MKKIFVLFIMILTTLLISCDYVPRMKLSELYEWDDNLDISQIEKVSWEVVPCCFMPGHLLPIEYSNDINDIQAVLDLLNEKVVSSEDIEDREQMEDATKTGHYSIFLKTGEKYEIIISMGMIMIEEDGEYEIYYFEGSTKKFENPYLSANKIQLHGSEDYIVYTNTEEPVELGTFENLDKYEFRILENQDLENNAKIYIEGSLGIYWYIISEKVFYYKNNFYEVVGENDFSEILALYEEK